MYVSVLAKRREYGGEQLHRYIYTNGRHTRVLWMHKTHKCHKPADQGGKERKEDLANAYGSVPHQLIESAMELYHLPEKVLGINCQEVLSRDEDPVHGR